MILMENTYLNCDILLVEDNPAEAALAKRAFIHNKIMNPVHHVSDGEEALNFIFTDQSTQNLATLQKLCLIEQVATLGEYWLSLNKIPTTI